MDVDGLRYTEVEHLGHAVVFELDIGGLEVPVNDLRAVRRFERRGNLHCDVQRLIRRDRAFGDAIRQGRALDQFHDDGSCAVALLQAENLRDVGVIE